MKNRWQLDPEVRDKYIPVIKFFIDKVYLLTEENVENISKEEFTLDLSDTELAPCHVWKIIEEISPYVEYDIEENGWEQDFWIKFACERHYFLVLRCCGMTRECILEVDWNADDDEY